MKLKPVFALALAALFLVLIAGCSQEQITNPATDNQGIGNNRTPQENLSVLNQSAKGVLPDQYIVQFSDGVTDVQGFVDFLAAKYGIIPHFTYLNVIKGFSVTTSVEIADALRQETGVTVVAFDHAVHSAAQGLPTGVNRIDADFNTFANIDGVPDVMDVDIAILDTGIEPFNSQLNVINGVSILGGVVSPVFNDDNGHGTHVAGIAAATDDTLSVVGVAPGAKLWAVKVLDATGAGFTSDVIAGLDWVYPYASDVEIINLSLSSVGYTSPFEDAVNNCVAAGMIVVAAAGNDAGDVYGADGVFGTDDDIIPAAFPAVSTISAFGDSDGRPGGLGNATSDGPDDTFATFSNFSLSADPTNPVVSPGLAIDLVMPGVDITSTIPGNGVFASTGTSMAAAHAAGLFALYIVENGRPLDSAGVIATRQAVIDAAVAQDSPRGLVTIQPDGSPAPLGFASLAQDIGDVSVFKFTGPATVLPGDILVLDVTLANAGPDDVTTPFQAWITIENNGIELARRTIPTLAAGTGISGQLQFQVPSATFSKAITPGTYTLTCSHDHFDTHPENDSSSIDVVLLESASMGAVFIDSQPESITPPWSLLAPDGIVYNSSGDFSFPNMIPGDYTMTWGEWPGWKAPDPETITLAGGTFITFTGLYIPAPGSIIIDPNPDALNAPWVLTGPDSYTVSASGDSTIGDLSAGDYTVTWGNVDAYQLPSPETQALANGSVITFSALYEKMPGTIIVNAEPDSINAPWTINYTDPSFPDSTITIEGLGDQTLNNMKPSLKYTIIWNPVFGFDSPNQEAAVLPAGDEITFKGTYVPSVGDVNIIPSPVGFDAPWSLDISDGSTIEGTGAALIQDVLAGQVVINWLPVAGYITPEPETKILVTGTVVTFEATYFQESNTAMGLYFDTGATQTCADAAFLSHVAAYIIYTDPNIPSTRGFELGIQFSRAGGETFNTSMTVTFPVQAVDVGVSTPTDGTYNYIAGYSDPMLTTAATVLATLDIFYLEMPAEDITMAIGPAIPSSSFNDLPMIMLEDFSLEDVFLANPSATLSAGGCAAKTASASSIEGVRNLFK